MKRKELNKILDGGEIHFDRKYLKEHLPSDAVYLGSIEYVDPYRPTQGSVTSFYYSPKWDIYLEAFYYYGMKWGDNYIKKTTLSQIYKELEDEDAEIDEESCKKYAPSLLELEEEI